MTAQERKLVRIAEDPAYAEKVLSSGARSTYRSAIVDALVASDDPHIGCSLTCTEVKWDDIASSEAAFYRATRAAITTLRAKETWSFIPKGT